jgi:hypothetical protein
MSKKLSYSDGLSLGDHTEAMTETVAEKEEELLCQVMSDHLDIMLAIVLKLREDPEYASSIYSSCPRLQHLLTQHPDLRPVFEDPKLVCLNFEEVYKKAGGVLPEDQPGLIRRILRIIVTHPLFKVLKALLFIKKIFTCVLGGGFGFLSSMFVSGSIHHATNTAGDNLHDELNDGNPMNQDNRESLNRAADYMDGKVVGVRIAWYCRDLLPQVTNLVFEKLSRVFKSLRYRKR